MTETAQRSKYLDPPACWVRLGKAGEVGWEGYLDEGTRCVGRDRRRYDTQDRERKAVKDTRWRRERWIERERFTLTLQICPFKSAFCILPRSSPNGPRAFLQSNCWSPRGVEGAAGLREAALWAVRKARDSSSESKLSWEVMREMGTPCAYLLDHPWRVSEVIALEQGKSQRTLYTSLRGRWPVLERRKNP